MIPPNSSQQPPFSAGFGQQQRPITLANSVLHLQPMQPSMNQGLYHHPPMMNLNPSSQSSGMMGGRGVMFNNQYNTSHTSHNNNNNHYHYNQGDVPSYHQQGPPPQGLTGHGQNTTFPPQPQHQPQHQTFVPPQFHSEHMNQQQLFPSTGGLFDWVQELMNDPAQIPPLPGSASSQEPLPQFHALNKIDDPIHYELLPVTAFEYNHWRQTKQALILQAVAEKQVTAIDFVDNNKVFHIVKVGNCFIYMTNTDMFDKTLSVDVLVNCANPYEESPLSQEFKTAAGTFVSHEFSMKMETFETHSQAGIGTLIETSHGNLSNFKFIYHLLLPNDGELEEDVIVKAVENILQTAEQNKIKSLAIPPFRHEGEQLSKVIKVMTKTLEKYFVEHPESCIREIHLIKKDSNAKGVHKAFSNAFDSLKNSYKIYLNQDPTIKVEMDMIDDSEFTGTFRFYDSSIGRYEAFTTKENIFLCEQYIKNPKASVSFKDDAGKEYLINFELMEQRNTSTGVNNSIQLIPKKASEGYLDAVWFYKDAYQRNIPFKAQQCRKIEQFYREGKKLIELDGSAILFNYHNQTFEKIDQSSNTKTEVVRYPVLKIVENQKEIHSFCKKGDLLYVVYADAGTLYCVSDAGTSCVIINESDTKAITITKIPKKKTTGMRPKMHMIKLISPLQHLSKRFTSEKYNQFLSKFKTSKTITISIQLEKFMEKHKEFKVLPPHLLHIQKIGQTGNNYTVTGFSPIVDQFIQQISENTTSKTERPKAPSRQNNTQQQKSSSTQQNGKQNGSTKDGKQKNAQQPSQTAIHDNQQMQGTSQQRLSQPPLYPQPQHQPMTMQTFLHLNNYNKCHQGLSFQQQQQPQQPYQPQLQQGTWNNQQTSTQTSVGMTVLNNHYTRRNDY
nr:unnamed protein product [Naegleria fowleri]